MDLGLWQTQKQRKEKITAKSIELITLLNDLIWHILLLLGMVLYHFFLGPPSIG